MVTEEQQQAALIWTPFGDADQAKAALDTLLAERLVACGNIVPGMQSAFLWRGTQETGLECGVLFKTAADRLNAAMARLEVIHPYESPAVTGWTVQASEGTLTWIVSETRDEENERS